MARDLMKANPHNTLFVFDLHGVIFKHDYKKMIKIIWKTNNKLMLLAHILNPKVLWSLAKLLWNQAVSEQYILHFSQYCKHFKDKMDTA